MNRSSSFTAIQTDCSQELCCVHFWPQFLLLLLTSQEVAQRGLCSFIVTRHQATVMNRFTWLTRAPALPKHLSSHDHCWGSLVHGPECDSLFLVCPWPWNCLSTPLHVFCVLLCVSFSSTETHLQFFVCQCFWGNLSEVVGIALMRIQQAWGLV